SMASIIIASAYTVNNNGDKQHPCRTPVRLAAVLHRRRAHRGRGRGCGNGAADQCRTCTGVVTDNHITRITIATFSRSPIRSLILGSSVASRWEAIDPPLSHRVDDLASGTSLGLFRYKS